MVQLIEILLEFLKGVLCLCCIDIVERDADECAEGNELLFLYTRLWAATGADEERNEDECQMFYVAMHQRLMWSKFCRKAVHQLPGDIQAIEFIEFADAGRAGHVDLGEIVANDIQADKI